MVARSWAAFAAIGAGLIHLALVVDTSLPVGVALAVVGIAEFGWGVLVLFDGRFLVARFAIGAALVPVGLWIATLLFDGPSVRPIPLAAATLLDFAVAIVLAVSMRRAHASGPRPRVVAAVILGALVVAGVTLPAILATSSGQSVLDPRFTENQHH
jgi:hypothetical protein